MKIILWESKEDNFQMFHEKRPLELLIIHSQRVVSSYAKNKITWLVGTRIKEKEKEILICEEFVNACKLYIHSARNLQTDLKYFEGVLN